MPDCVKSTDDWFVVKDERSNQIFPMVMSSSWRGPKIKDQISIGTSPFLRWALNHSPSSPSPVCSRSTRSACTKWCSRWDYGSHRIDNWLYCFDFLSEGWYENIISTLDTSFLPFQKRVSHELFARSLLTLGKGGSHTWRELIFATFLPRKLEQKGRKFSEEKCQIEK